MKTAAWYVGTQCKCGPYTRETDYFGTENEAWIAFDTVERLFELLEHNALGVDGPALIKRHPEARIRT